MHQNAPAVKRNEQKQLEWYGDSCRRNHLHSESQQDIRDDKIDNHKHDIDNEADLERFGQLAQRKARYEDHQVVLFQFFCLLRWSDSGC